MRLLVTLALFQMPGRFDTLRAGAHRRKTTVPRCYLQKQRGLPWCASTMRWPWWLFCKSG